MTKPQDGETHYERGGPFFEEEFMRLSAYWR